MKRYWHTVSEKFDAMPVRERVLLVGAALAVLYLLWSLLLLAPVDERTENLVLREQALDEQLRQLQQQEKVFNQALQGGGPEAGKKRELAALQQRLQALDERLQALSVGLVPAEQLPQVLHDVLISTGELTLLGMRTLPVQRLSLQESGDVEPAEVETFPQQKETASQVSVFRHAVQLKVRGTYFAMTEYIRALETLPWRFYWDELNYEVADYPAAVATIEVYTLSAGEGLLGEK